MLQSIDRNVPSQKLGFVGRFGRPFPRILQTATIALLADLSLGLGTSAQAQVTLLAWETDGLSGTTADPFSATTTGINMQPSNLTRGAAITASSLGNGFAADSWGSSSLAEENDYFQITAQPTSEFSFNLDTIKWHARRSSTGPNNMQWVYSLDNFATPAIPIGTAISYTTNPGNGSAFSVDTSGLADLRGVTNQLTLRLYGWGATNSSGTFAIGRLAGDDLELIGQTLSTGSPNNSVFSVPATTDFGRVMAGSIRPVTLSNAGESTTWSTSAEGGFSPAPTGSVGADGASAISVGVGTALGERSGTLTVTNTAPDSAGSGLGSDQPAITSNLSATVVQNRQVGTPSAPPLGAADNVIDIGQVLVGAVVSGSGTITTAGADAENTRVAVNANQEIVFTTPGEDPSTGGTGAYTRLSTGEVSVVFDNPNASMVVTGEAAYGRSGSQTSNFAQLTSGNGGLTGEGLAGEVVRNAQIYFQADVYQAASLQKGAGQNAPIASGGFISALNADTSDEGQRAAAEIIAKVVSGDSGWSVSGFEIGTTVAAGSSAEATALFDPTDRLNGTYLGVLSVDFQHADQTIVGTASGDLGSLGWNLRHTVSGRTGGGAATLLAGQDLTRFGTSRGEGQGSNTTLTFLAGVSSEARTLQVAFRDPVEGEQLFSDVVTVTGLSGERFVMSLSYDETLLGGINAENLRLGWLNEGVFVNAVDGNIASSDIILDSPFGGSWSAYLEANSGADLTNSLGAYGVDTKEQTVWAVIDHNSAFAAAIPEPTTYALIFGVGILGLALLRHRVVHGKQKEGQGERCDD